MLLARIQLQKSANATVQSFQKVSNMQKHTNALFFSICTRCKVMVVHAPSNCPPTEEPLQRQTMATT